MKIGRRLAIKLLNASKFVLTITNSGDVEQVTDPLDQAMLTRLNDTVKSATAAFEDFNYAKALDTAESFFWEFTDDYVELVKERAYGESDGMNTQSARSALYLALTIQLRLFAPFLPFTTEETWSWFNDDSIHSQQWPDSTKAVINGDPQIFTDAQTALGLVRKAKSEAKVSMKAEVSNGVFSGSSEQLERLKLVQKDLAAAGNIRKLDFVTTQAGIHVAVELATS